MSGSGKTVLEYDRCEVYGDSSYSSVALLVQAARPDITNVGAKSNNF